MNRVRELLEEPEEPPQRVGDGDFWVIGGLAGVFYVSAETAQRVAREMEAWRVPRWITFVDLAGSRVRIRGRDVYSFCESTELQRARDRAFFRARRSEDEVDRPAWEGDDG